jgi:hypothetical protein
MPNVAPKMQKVTYLMTWMNERQWSNTTLFGPMNGYYKTESTDKSSSDEDEDDNDSDDDKLDDNDSDGNRCFDDDFPDPDSGSISGW